ncbi:MAG TPA: GNAT family N-acetyltransferase [Myxococcota bacterium]|nr:GNAT family N-acetyltransferase [Myxococcota bacterium]
MSGIGTSSSAREIQEIEARAARAWPALEVVERAGWWLRAGPDETWRTRSVLPQPPPEGSRDTPPLSARIREVEAFYAARGLPARFQVHDAAMPAELDACLAARSFERGKPTHVLTAALERLAARAGERVGPALAVALCEGTDARWLEAYGHLQGLNAAALEGRRALLERVRTPRFHALVERDGVAIAAGFAVCESGHAGLFGLVTAPEARRRGAAFALLRGLAHAALEHGAHGAYLQVEAANEPALSLYARCGFERHHGYHYRTAPGPGPRRG